MLLFSLHKEVFDVSIFPPSCCSEQLVIFMPTHEDVKLHTVAMITEMPSPSVGHDS